jgi:hypothetical protein
MRTPDNLPCSSSISIQSCCSLPNIQLILFPHLPPPLPYPLTNPCISYHSSPCTILRVQKKRDRATWGCWSYHPLPSNSTRSAYAPDVSYTPVIYDAECSNISKITMSRFENLFGRFSASSTSQATIYYTFHVPLRRENPYTLPSFWAHRQDSRSVFQC